MEARFGYKRDKRCKWLTAVWLVIIAGVPLFLVFGMESSYMRAWILAFGAAILALYILSIPRYVKVDDDYLEIHCVVEMTRIDVRDVVNIRKIDPDGYTSRFMCLLGSYGFFGYYGYYLDFRQWDFVKVYATERCHLVLIEDIYEQSYLISCRDCDRLVEAVTQAKLNHPGTSPEEDD
ncbi:MAG: PH domain-containing protein [Alistipes sp.]|nr:PH domain-containing protein [Alistipes sp.]